MDKEQLLYQIGITLIPNIGDVLAKNLISYCGGAKEAFNTPVAKLKKIPSFGEFRVNEVIKADVLKQAEEEVKFIEKHKITPIFYTNPKYPQRLKNCIDSPILLYYKGNADLNATKIISIVGTRRATDYGKAFCEQLVEGLKPLNVLIVSGLAYGIDVCAHKSALKNGLNTVACLGHGLDRLYPAAHKGVAKEIIEQGGLLSEFMSNSRADKENFPKRNRIIAGMSDATVVIETKIKGGSRITAEIANSYSRDVFAVPGNVNSQYSEGCHYLIKTNRAALLDSTQELIEAMGWDEGLENTLKAVQREIFIELNEVEQKLVDLIKANDKLRIDELLIKSNLPGSAIAANLLSLELKGLVKTLPGKIYKLT